MTLIKAGFLAVLLTISIGLFADDKTASSVVTNSEAPKYNSAHPKNIWDRIEIYVWKDVPNPDPKTVKTIPTISVHHPAGTMAQMASGLNPQQKEAYDNIKAKLLSDLQWMQTTMRNGTPALWDTLQRVDEASEATRPKIIVSVLSTEIKNAPPNTLHFSSYASLRPNDALGFEILDRLVRWRNDSTQINSAGTPNGTTDHTFNQLWRAWNQEIVLQGDRNFSTRDGTQKRIGAETPISQITWAYQGVFSSAHDWNRTDYLALGRRLGLDVLQGPQQDHYRTLYGMMAQIAASNRPLSSFSNAELDEIRARSTESFVDDLIRSSILAYNPKVSRLQYLSCADRVGALASH